jgi:hypothetical protein
MFHVPPAMVKAGLVQFPVDCVAGMSTVAGPTATEEVVVEDDPAAEAAPVVVVVTPAAPVLVVVAPAAPVLVVPPVALEAPVDAVPCAAGSL